MWALTHDLFSNVVVSVMALVFVMKLPSQEKSVIVIAKTQLIVSLVMI